MALTPDEIWSQLDALARSMEPPVRAAFRAAIAKLRAALTDADLLRIAETGDLRPLVDKLDLTDYKLAVRQSLLRAADSSGLPFEVRFDALDPFAVRAIQTAELALVSGLSTEIQAGVRQFLEAGIRNGINPRTTATDLRPLVGLGPKEMQAVANYRGLLTGGAKGQPYMEALRRATRDGRFDRTLLQAINDKTPLKPAQVTRQLDRFQERLIARRAETIARTETIAALYRAQQMRWQEAINAGKVKEGELRRFWHTAKDERTCPICKAIPEMNPEGVGFNVPFQTEVGELMGPTAHPNCRCVVFIRIVFEKRAWSVLARDLSGLRRVA